MQCANVRESIQRIEAAIASAENSADIRRIDEALDALSRSARRLKETGKDDSLDAQGVPRNATSASFPAAGQHCETDKNNGCEAASDDAHSS